MEAGLKTAAPQTVPERPSPPTHDIAAGQHGTNAARVSVQPASNSREAQLGRHGMAEVHGKSDTALCVFRYLQVACFLQTLVTVQYACLCSL